MTIVYLWDPAARKIRAWVIASDGSWSQAMVEVENGAIRLNTKGVTPDGVPIAMISPLRPTDESTRTEQWTDITAGGKPQPSPPAIIWKRK